MSSIKSAVGGHEHFAMEGGLEEIDTNAINEDGGSKMTTMADGEEGVYSPVAGSLWKLVVFEVGAKFKAGDTLAILESMKTEIPVVADEDGVITQVFGKQGSEVRSGQCLFAVKH